MSKNNEKIFVLDVGYNKERSFIRKDPMTLAFAYPKNNSPIIFKGSRTEVDKRIAKFVDAGMKALVFTINLKRLGTRRKPIPSHNNPDIRRKKTIQHRGQIYGLPVEYEGFVAKIRPQSPTDFSTFYSDFPSVNKNHNYILAVYRKNNERDHQNQALLSTPFHDRVVLVKTFKSQPRCWPSCLDRFLQPNETGKIRATMSA